MSTKSLCSEAFRGIIASELVRKLGQPVCAENKKAFKTNSAPGGRAAAENSPLAIGVSFCYTGGARGYSSVD